MKELNEQQKGWNATTCFKYIYLKTIIYISTIRELETKIDPKY
jgi:hypothetical protein